MTREEAIKDIQENIKPFIGGKSLDMAIKALSQPIVCKDYCINDDNIYCSPKVAERVVEALHAERPRWIPCSERPPRYDETDETSEYLVTDKEGRVRHCCLDSYMPETFVTVEEGMIVDAVAWRPAPEPWKGDKNE